MCEPPCSFLPLIPYRYCDGGNAELDIMLTGYIGGGSSIPEALQLEFEGLSKEDQTTIRNFVNWMRIANVPWSRRYIENVFTPHTPRPDILFER